MQTIQRRLVPGLGIRKLPVIGMEKCLHALMGRALEIASNRLTIDLFHMESFFRAAFVETRPGNRATGIADIIPTALNIDRRPFAGSD